LLPPKRKEKEKKRLCFELLGAEGERKRGKEKFIGVWGYREKKKS